MEKEMQNNLVLVLVAGLLVLSFVNTASVFAMTQQIELLNSNLAVLSDNAGGNNVPTQVIKNEPQAQAPTQTAPSAVEVSVDDDPVLGSSDAPVTIIEFSDFECPFCGRFYQNTLPLIKENYIDTGKVKLVYRDFPLNFHPDAQKAAEAAECAGDQGKYWEMHDAIFENQSAIGVADLKAYAKNLGLDSTAFDSCLDSGDKASEVLNDLSDGQKAGVSGTPTFFINGTKVVGAQAFSKFEEVIEAKLAE